MSLPIPQDVRDYLEGFGVLSTLLTDGWITNTRDDEIVPLVEKGTALSLIGEKQVTEYYSGNGTPRLLLDRSPIKSLDDFAYTNSFDSNITLDAIAVDKAQGTLISEKSIENSNVANRSLFAKGTNNIKITYTYGYEDADIPKEICRAVLLLLASECLRQIRARCGGGDLSIKELSRSYGNLGEYGTFIREISRKARALLDPYNSGVVGA